MPYLYELFTDQQVANAIRTTRTLADAAELLGNGATREKLRHWKSKHRLIDYSAAEVAPAKIPFRHNNQYVCTVPGVFKCVLAISDLHIPYHHPDTFAFLAAIKDKYFPLYAPEETLVIDIGDEADWHFLNYHDHDPDLLSGGEEVKAVRRYMAELQRLFPVMHLLESNHGSLYFRKALTNGVSRGLLMTYSQLLGVNKGWTWHPTMTICTGEGKYVNFHHGRNTNVIVASRTLGMSLVQGHHHSKFCIQYWGNPLSLNYGMNVGCLIDDDSYAFQYNRLTVERPVIGCGIILNGKPELIPMELGNDGRWVGHL